VSTKRLAGATCCARFARGNADSSRWPNRTEGLVFSAAVRQRTADHLLSRLGAGGVALSAGMDPEDFDDIVTPITPVSRRTCSASATSWSPIWAAGFLSTSAIPRYTRTTPNARFAPGRKRVAAVAALKTRASLQTRVGTATGRVVIADLFRGSDAARE
jgi:hypothetical protein